MKRFILAAFFIIPTLAGLAQEGLRPLRSNLSYIYTDLKLAKPAVKQNTAQKTEGQSASLFIPFIEDFYYAQSSSYPDQNKWRDSGVYVNQGFPIGPPSIGVATFDGLNKFGYPYNPAILNNNISFPADTLTSRPINLLLTANSQTLQPSDSIGLSFFYESTGYGDPPDVADSLILDFYSPLDSMWVNNIWSKTRSLGSNLTKQDTTFNRVFIRIDSAIFLQDSFQFRFRNKATTTGNFDHWHVDYIYLNEHRSVFDTVFDDLTFTYVPTPLLRDYASMPWEQYNASEMATHNLVQIKNNGNSSINMSYQYKIDSVNKQLSFYTGNAYILAPGTSTYIPHANPTVNYTFAPMTDSVDYTIVHNVYRASSSSDFIPGNDTVIQHQRFRNYYAQDDGGAEAGYYLNAPGAKMAIKVNVNVADSFLGARIYFDPVGSVNTASSSLGFHIAVWASGSAGPGLLLYRDTVFKPTYYNQAPAYASAEFKLVRPQLLQPGTYYIGIQQLADPNYITIGFDCNVDHRNNLYYNVGSTWVQSTQKGSLMIRPIFGRTLPHPVGIPDILPASSNNIVVYPNPTTDQLTIRSSYTGSLSYTLFNVMGQNLREGQVKAGEELLNTSSLPAGIYFLAFRNELRQLQQQKIIIQR